MSPCIETRRARPLLGTFVEIAALTPNEQRLEGTVERGFAAVSQVHRLMSRHDPMSDLSQLNRGAARRWVKVHRWTAQVLRAAARFSEESKGAFDITLGAGGSWRDVMVGRDNCIKFRRRLTLDLGGIAKGFAVDRAVAVMRSAGVVSGMVNAGGDLRVFGREPQPVQI
ncbi:MAG: FAD:protein FMN transferase, partial [Bryobacteraceae bacterium]